MECNRSHNWKEWRGGGKLSYLLMMNWISEERCRWCAMLRIRCAAGYRNWFLPEIIGVRPWAIGFAQFELPIYFFSVWLCCDNLIIVVPRRREDSTLFKENFQTLLRGGQVKKKCFSLMMIVTANFHTLRCISRKKRGLFEVYFKCVFREIIVLRVLWAFFAPVSGDPN